MRKQRVARLGAFERELLAEFIFGVYTHLRGGDLKGALGSCNPVSSSTHLFPLPARLTLAHVLCVYSTTNGSAKTKGADTTVNGYLIFILYSVALLACTSSFSLC